MPTIGVRKILYTSVPSMSTSPSGTFYLCMRQRCIRIFTCPLAISLAQAGIRIWLPDLRGHGRSFGIRGHVKSFDAYVEDITAVWHHFMASTTDRVPTVIGGESLGGLIACLAAQRSIPCHGLFVTSPALALNFSLPPTIAPHLWRWRSIIGRVHSIRPLPLGGITVNPQIVDLIDRDPLATHHYTLNFLLQLLSAQQHIPQPMSLTCPSLAVFSHHDPIIDAEQSAMLFSTSPSSTVQFVDGILHSVVADAPDYLRDTFLAWYRQDVLQSPPIHLPSSPDRPDQSLL